MGKPRSANSIFSSACGPVCGLLNLSIGKRATVVGGAVRDEEEEAGGEGGIIVTMDRVIKRGRNRPSCRTSRLPRPRFTIRSG